MQLSLNKFFDPSTSSIRKGHDGGKTRGKKMGEKRKGLMRIVATASLPAVDRPIADRWNAARSCQKNVIYGVPNANQLERRMLVLKIIIILIKLRL